MGRARFLVFVPGVALALAAGCFAEPRDDPSTDGTGGAGEPRCPGEVPLVGSACSTADIGLSCGRSFSCDVWVEWEERLVTCEPDGIWRQPRLTCEPWPPEGLGGMGGGNARGWAGGFGGG